MKRTVKMILIFVVIISLFTGLASAKKAIITGYAEDEDGNRIKGKDIKIVNKNNGHEWTGTTDEKDGHFRLEKDENDDSYKSGHFEMETDNHHDEKSIDHDDWEEKYEGEICDWNKPPNTIPEFPTVALPIAAVIGLVSFFQYKKKEE